MNNSASQPPLIYVASMRRSGSKVISEALTQLPDCFVFREPGTSAGKFKIQPSAMARLAECGVDKGGLEAVPRDFVSSEAVGDALAADILPMLSQAITLVGIKEIRLEGWSSVLASVAPRCVLTVRDPRDIYLSLRDQEAKRIKMAKRKVPTMPGGVTPTTVADYINTQHRCQAAISNKYGACSVRYEDLCRDSAGVLARIRKHCGLHAVQDASPLGSKTKHDHGIRGNGIDDTRAARWQREDDEERLAGAHATFERVPEFNDVWGYGVSGAL